jgi:hypothetical protein
VRLNCTAASPKNPSVTAKGTIIIGRNFITGFP